jgi:cytochrome c oxidase subunit 1
MFFQGMAGMSRRMYDGGLTYAAVPATATSPGIPGLSPFILGLNRPIFIAAICLGLAQIPFIVNFFWSIHHGKKVASDNPWDATTLDWQTPTPPPHGNFDKPVEVFRGPYEYSVPGHASDFIPQNEPVQPQPLTHGNTVRS